MSHNVVCRLTAKMPAALATIGVHGPDAIGLVWSKIQPSRPPVRMPIPPSATELVRTPARIYFAHWPVFNGEVSEQVVICATDLNTVEVNCHGGVAVTNEIVESLRSAGCRVVNWTTWSRLTSHPTINLCTVDTDDVLNRIFQQPPEEPQAHEARRQALCPYV